MPNSSKRERFNMLISRDGLDAIDRHRGIWSRSEYVRRALSEAVHAGLVGPKRDNF